MKGKKGKKSARGKDKKKEQEEEAPEDENEEVEEVQQVEERPKTPEEHKQRQAEIFQKYLENTGISMTFQIIFAEILSKKIKEEKVFAYTAMRLREIGAEKAKSKVKAEDQAENEIEDSDD